MAKHRYTPFEGHGFREMTPDESKDTIRRLQRKIRHNDSLAVDGVAGIFHDVPKPARTFDVSSSFDEADFAAQMTKVLKRLRTTCPKLFIAKTFSNFFWLDLEAWDKVWPPEVHPLGFTIDTCYFIAEDYGFGFITVPYTRKIHFFGEPLLALLPRDFP